MVKATRPKTSYGTSTGSGTTLYTCPSNAVARVVSLGADGTIGSGGTGPGPGGAHQLFFQVYDASATATYQFTSSISTPFYTDEITLLLESGDYIVGNASGSGAGSPDIDFFVTVEETFIPVG